MNEMILSNDLNQIELEIKHHKNIAGQSIWEIGRRLNHVKENDLTHGSFMKWLEKNEFSYTTANQFMKVAKELPNFDPGQNLGITALYLIATLPEEEREKTHTLDSGEVKKPDEMTKRELEEVKRKLREKESQLERAEQSEQIAIEKLEREQNKKPEVIREQVEPDDYNYLKRSNEQLKNQLSAIEERNYKMASEIKKHETDSEKYRQLNEEMKKMNNQLTDGQKKLKAQKEVYDLVRNANQLITEVAPLTYLIDTENILDNEYARKPIEKIINNLRDMADRLDTSINQNIYEGEIINE